MDVDELTDALPGTRDQPDDDPAPRPAFTPTPPSRRGHHVAFTGTDGAGKSTQAGLLARRMKDAGGQAYVTEGKDDFHGEVLRRWSAVTGHDLSPDFMHAVWALDVLKDVSRNVHPMLAGGIDVVAPRSIYCQVAIARALELPSEDRLASLLSFYGEPDLTIMLDVPVDVTIARVRRRGFDEEDPGLMTSFRRELHALARERRIVVVDGAGTVEQVHREVWEAYQDFVATRGSAS